MNNLYPRDGCRDFSPRLPSSSSSDDLMDVSSTVLADLDDDVLLCRICLDRLNVPIVTECLHRFCKECIGRHFRHYDEKRSTHRCPLCNMEIRSIRSLKPDTKVAGLLGILFPDGDQIQGSEKNEDSFCKHDMEEARKLHDKRRDAMIERSKEMLPPRSAPSSSSYNYVGGVGQKRSLLQKNLSYQQPQSSTNNAVTQDSYKNKPRNTPAVVYESNRTDVAYREEIQRVAKQSVSVKNTEALARIAMYGGGHFTAARLPTSFKYYHQIRTHRKFLEREDLMIVIEFVDVMIRRHPSETSLGVLSSRNIRAAADLSVGSLKKFLCQQKDICNKKGNFPVEITLDVGTPELNTGSTNITSCEILQSDDDSSDEESMSNRRPKKLDLFTLGHENLTLLQVCQWISKKSGASTELFTLNIFYRSSTSE